MRLESSLPCLGIWEDARPSHGRHDRELSEPDPHCSTCAAGVLHQHAVPSAPSLCTDAVPARLLQSLRLQPQPRLRPAAGHTARVLQSAVDAVALCPQQPQPLRCREPPRDGAVCGCYFFVVSPLSLNDTAFQDADLPAVQLLLVLSGEHVANQRQVGEDVAPVTRFSAQRRSEEAAAYRPLLHAAPPSIATVRILRLLVSSKAS